MARKLLVSDAVLVIKLDWHWLRGGLRVRKVSLAQQRFEVFSLIHDPPPFRGGPVVAPVPLTVASGVSASLLGTVAAIVSGISGPNLLKRSLLGVVSTADPTASDDRPGTSIGVQLLRDHLIVLEVVVLLSAGRLLLFACWQRGVISEG
jgi:hypothetical protein